MLPVLEALAKEPDVTLMLPDLNRRHREQQEEARESLKTGPESDPPPIAKTPPLSPPSHRGYYNSPKAQNKEAYFE